MTYVHRSRIGIARDVLLVIKEKNDDAPYEGASAFDLWKVCGAVSQRQRTLALLAKQELVASETHGNRLLWRITPKGREVLDTLCLLERDLGTL